MTHPSPSEALRIYRRISPPEVLDQVTRFKALSSPEQVELLFYMLVHQANAIGMIGHEVDIDLTEIPNQKDN